MKWFQIQLLCWAPNMLSCIPNMHPHQWPWSIHWSINDFIQTILVTLQMAPQWVKVKQKPNHHVKHPWPTSWKALPLIPSSGPACPLICLVGATADPSVVVWPTLLGSLPPRCIGFLLPHPSIEVLMWIPILLTGSPRPLGFAWGWTGDVRWLIWNG